MSAWIVCPRCGRSSIPSKVDDHPCDDADIRRHMRLMSAPMPCPVDIRARMSDAGVTAYNNFSTAIDQAARAILLVGSYLFLVAGRWLAEQELEISAIHVKTDSRLPNPRPKPISLAEARARGEGANG